MSQTCDTQLFGYWGCKSEGCRWRLGTEVCCCYGDMYVKILMNPSHNNTFSLLFRCNGGNLQYGSVLVTLIMAVISKFI